MSIASLERRIYNCPYTNTKECKGRFKCRPIPGYGSTHPKFLVIGINPALRQGVWRQYEKTQKALQEKYFDECNKYGYGVLLRELAQEIPEFDIPDTVYLTDIVRCPTVNGLPSPDMIKQCTAAYLEETVKLLKPKTIIAFGQTTANQVQYLQNQGIRIIPARHPSRASDVPCIAKEIKQSLFLIDNVKPRKVFVSDSKMSTNVLSTDVPPSKNVFGQAMDLWINRRDDERPAARSPAYDFFTRNLQRFVEGMVRRFGFSDLTVKASVGVGRWAEIPWIGIRSQEITTNFQEGIFVVYVFAPQFRNLYLTIIMGVNGKTIDAIRKEVSDLRRKVRMPEGFSIGLEGRLSTNEPLNSKPYNYRSGILYSKKYDLRQLPDSAVDSDLKAALDSYQFYAKTTAT